MVGDSVSGFVGKCAAGVVRGTGWAGPSCQEDSDRPEAWGPEPPLGSRGESPHSAGRPRALLRGGGEETGEVMVSGVKGTSQPGR